MTNVTRTVRDSQHVLLKLFVTGRTPNALRAREALHDLVKAHADRAIDVEVVDVLTDPEAASLEDVFATPTLIKKGDGPERRLVGDLSSVEKLQIGLLLEPAA